MTMRFVPSSCSRPRSPTRRSKACTCAHSEPRRTSPALSALPKCVMCRQPLQASKAPPQKCSVTLRSGRDMAGDSGLVKDLRQKTGAGIMDCKQALVENADDIAKAIDWLRQKGLASAGKKIGR